MLSLETRFPVFDISWAKFCILLQFSAVSNYFLVFLCNKYLYFLSLYKTCAFSFCCSNVFMANIVFRICTWPRNRYRIKSIISLWSSNQYSTNANIPNVLTILPNLNIYEKSDMSPMLETSTHEEVGSS